MDHGLTIGPAETFLVVPYDSKAMKREQGTIQGCFAETCYGLFLIHGSLIKPTLPNDQYKDGIALYLVDANFCRK